MASRTMLPTRKYKKAYSTPATPMGRRKQIKKRVDRLNPVNHSIAPLPDKILSVGCIIY